MKHTSILLVACFLIGAVLVPVSAAPIAENTYQKIQSMDFSQEDVDSIIQAYDDFYERIEKIAENALKDMEKARSKGDVGAYREAFDRYSAMTEYAMGKEETDRLLSRILEEPADKRTEYADWLYRRSRYYRPTLTIDFSVDGDTYHYSYAQKLRQAPGTQITLPDLSNMRINTSHIGMLAGWGITPDEATYAPGETISMPVTDQTLYAIWTNAVRFSDAITETVVEHEGVKEGDIVPVPVIESPADSFRFIGWYDRTTGTLLDNESEYTVKGKGAVFEGLWKQLSVEAISPLYYGFDRLPTNTQLAVGFSLANGGNTNLRNIEATLTTVSPHVKILCDTVMVRDIPAGRHRTNNSRFATSTQQAISGSSNTFRIVIDEATPKGTPISFTLTFTDHDGQTWSSQVSFTTR